VIHAALVTAVHVRVRCRDVDLAGTVACPHEVGRARQRIHACRWWGRRRRRWRRRRRRWGRDAGGLRSHGEADGSVATPGCRGCKRDPGRLWVLQVHDDAHGVQIEEIGKVSEGWWPGPESNQRHPHFQCGALPTELPGPQECIPKDVQKPEYNKSLSGTQLGAWGDGRLKGASNPQPRLLPTCSAASALDDASGAIGKGRAGNRSVARSCRPPVCSDRCSTFRKAPLVRPCTDRRDVRTWQLRPYNEPPPRLYAPPRSAARSSVHERCLPGRGLRPDGLSAARRSKNLQIRDFLRGCS